MESLRKDACNTISMSSLEEEPKSVLTFFDGAVEVSTQHYGPNGYKLVSQELEKLQMLTPDQGGIHIDEPYWLPHP